MLLFFRVSIECMSYIPPHEVSRFGVFWVVGEKEQLLFFFRERDSQMWFENMSRILIEKLGLFAPEW